MKKVIIDCDNTFGVEGCDLDDGLAIIYALGSGACNLLAVTTTFGNNTLEVVYPNTISFMEEIGMDSVPVFMGHVTNPQKNDAAKYIVDTTKKYPGEVTVICTGSLTNLYHAYLLDPSIFDRIPELSLMGGVIMPLIINEKKLDELNFSCNSIAALSVLRNGKNIKIATGNICMDAFFTKQRFDKLFESEASFLRWLNMKGQYWFSREKEYFDHDGIYKWDVYAAAAALYPEFFDFVETEITPDEQSMKTGSLIGDGAPIEIFIPVLKNISDYIEHVYCAYSAFAGLNC